MDLLLPSRDNLHRITHDSIYRNSFFLVFSMVLNNAFGFIFWLIAARYYSIEDVGLGTALISSIGLIVLLSRLGFDSTIIRFFPNSDKRIVFNTCLLTSLIASSALALIYILGVDYFSPGLSIIKELDYALIFVLFVMANSISLAQGNAFMALRKTYLYSIQTIFLSLRVPLLFVCVSLNSLGILISNFIAIFMAAMIGYFQLTKILGIFSFEFDITFLRRSLKFSVGNYLSNIFSSIPILVIPIMILNMIGEADAARYYISFTVGNLILIIPTALSTSLFIEGSYGEDLKKNLIKAISACYLLLIPGVISIFVLSEPLLGLFGRDYSGSVDLLRIISLSSFFAATYSMFISIQNVKMNISSIIRISLIRLVFILVLSYVFISYYGIIGVGFAWITTHLLLNLIIFAELKHIK